MLKWALLFLAILSFLALIAPAPARASEGFTEQTHYMSCPGACRWLQWRMTRQWISYAEAAQRVEANTK